MAVTKRPDFPTQSWIYNRSLSGDPSAHTTLTVVKKERRGAVPHLKWLRRQLHRRGGAEPERLNVARVCTGAFRLRKRPRVQWLGKVRCIMGKEGAPSTTQEMDLEDKRGFSLLKCQRYSSA